MSETVERREYEEYCKRMAEEDNRQNKRIDKLEASIEQISKLTMSIERMTITMEGMQKEQVKQGQKLEKIENQDGDKWRTVKMCVITAIASGAAGYLLKLIVENLNK